MHRHDHWNWLHGFPFSAITQLLTARIKSQLCQQSDNYSRNTARADPPPLPAPQANTPTYWFYAKTSQTAADANTPTYRFHQHSWCCHNVKIRKKKEKHYCASLVLVEILSCIHTLCDSDKSKQVRPLCSLQVNLLSRCVCVRVCMCVCVHNKSKTFFQTEHSKSTVFIGGNIANEIHGFSYLAD